MSKSRDEYAAEIRERNNQRYREDPEFRERVKAASRKYYENKRKDKMWRMKKCEKARNNYYKRKQEKMNNNGQERNADS